MQRVRVADDTSPRSWQHLLALWQAGNETGAADTLDCALVLAPGLHCVHGNTRLDKLARLGRPALLRLRADRDEAWALLLGVDAVQVRLQLDGAVFDTSRIALEQAWDGEYVALWRTPGFVSAPIGAGSSELAIQWIRQQLEVGENQHATRPAMLDAQMIAAIRRFQRTHGLATDGVVGPETLMALAAGQDGPALLRVLE